MRDLIFVIKTDGTYQKVPLKKLRGQENYSDNFVVIANRLGIVKANIRLLGRTDKVITQFLIPTFEKAEDLIGNEPYFQDYADAKVWRIGVSKEALRDISQSYSGQIEVSFSFLTFVDDERALNNIGDLTTELPIEAEEGDYLVCKLSSYTKDDITWTYGQLAIYHNSEWIKGGKYRVEGNTTTHKMSVEPTLIGTLPEEDIEDEEGIRDALENLADEIDTRTKANASDIEDILDGTKYVYRAYKDRNDNVIHTHYATKNELDSEIVKIVNGTTLVDKAKKDQLGNVIDEKYINADNYDLRLYQTDLNNFLVCFQPYGDYYTKAKEFYLPKASGSQGGLMLRDDKIKLDALETTYIKKDTKGVAGGVVPLDNNTKIALTYLYDGVLGQLEYVGTFDGVTLPSMTQNLSPNRAVRKGDYFIAIGSGIINGVDFEIGDWLIFNSPSTWAKIDNTDAVSLVNNKKGVVVLDGTDINWADDENKTIKAKISEIDIELADIYRKDQVYTKNEIDNLLDQLIEVTWQELKDKRDAGLLTPGQQYRITDYITTTVQENTQSAGHQFDLIVVADSVNKLNEQARAIQHDGDTYFADSKLEAWKLKYCLDNDTNRFAWADEGNGKGVIYRMIDEFNNDVPYDFKNIQFIRKITDGEYDPDGNDRWVYTFTWVNEDDEIEDLSLIGNSLLNDEGSISGVFNNKISETSAYSKSIGEGNSVFALGNNTFISSYAYEDGAFYGCYGNKFGVNCFGNTFSNNVYNNSFGNSVHSNSFGNSVHSNSFGNNCYANTFGDGCYANTFGVNCFGNTFGDGGYANTFGNNCYANTFGNNCYANTFGNNCNYNTFGNGCSDNTFGNNCYANTFGDGCYANTFGNNCYANTFGDGCYANTFGNNCYANTFGNNCYADTFGVNCFGNTFGNEVSNNTFGNECFYLQISDNTFTQKRYIHVENGTQGASNANKFDLYDAAILNKDYQVTFKKSASGKYLMLWATDTGTMTGKYKEKNTATTWTTLPPVIEELLEGIETLLEDI